jgi:hypothetical protein
MKINYLDVEEAIDYLKQFSCLDNDPSWPKRFVVRGTSWVLIIGNSSSWGSHIKSKIYMMNQEFESGICEMSIEKFLSEVSPEVFEEFLFHIDMFR